MYLLEILCRFNIENRGSSRHKSSVSDHETLTSKRIIGYLKQIDNHRNGPFLSRMTQKYGESIWYTPFNSDFVMSMQTMPNQKEFSIGFLWDGPPHDQEAI